MGSEMDERHWWFAARLQETFHFGGYDGPTLLEDFLSDPEVMELISSFLGPGEPRKLFFYCEEAPPLSREGSRTPSAGSRRLRAVAELDGESSLSRAAGRVCLYVLRSDSGGEVGDIDREVLCGELRHSALSSLASLLCEAYNPLLRRQKDWGQCSETAVAGFLQNLQLHSCALQDAATVSQTKRGLLARPSTELQVLQQQQQGRGVLSIDTVGECEELIEEWTNCIESLLLDTADERWAKRVKISSNFTQKVLSGWRIRRLVPCRSWESGGRGSVC